MKEKAELDNDAGPSSDSVWVSATNHKNTQKEKLCQDNRK